MPWWLLVGPKIGECYKCEDADYNSCWATHRQCSLASQDILRGSGARLLETHRSRSGGQHRLFFLEFLRTSIRRATRPQVLYRQHQLQKRLHGHWYLCIHFSFADWFNVEFAMTLPFPYSACYWFDSGYASLRFLATLIVPTYVFQDRNQQRTLEQFSDTPVPQV